MDQRTSSKTGTSTIAFAEHLEKHKGRTQIGTRLPPRHSGGKKGKIRRILAGWITFKTGNPGRFRSHRAIWEFRLLVDS